MAGFSFARSSVRTQYDLRQRLEEFLIYGSYPEIVATEGRKEKIELLEELAGSYLLKNVLTLERIRSSRTLVDLLKLFGFDCNGHQNSKSSH